MKKIPVGRKQRHSRKVPFAEQPNRYGAITYTIRNLGEFFKYYWNCSYGLGKMECRIEDQERKDYENTPRELHRKIKNICGLELTTETTIDEQLKAAK